MYYKKGDEVLASASLNGTNAKDWVFELISDEYDSEGNNIVTFKFHFNTEKISTKAAANVSVQFKAIDKGSPSIQSGNVVYANAKPSVPGTTSTKAGALTGCYKIDIVPYVTKVSTSLGKLKANNPSVYARTAKGNYAVSASEILNFEGFNISGGQVKFVKTGGYVNASYDANAGGEGVGGYVIPSEAKSGSISLVVKNIESLNNLNNNEAKGSYTGTTTSVTGDRDIFSNYYNRQPNGDNNNLLTDDLELDVWEFDPQAVKPKIGTATQPVMKIDPVTGKIGFAFVNGNVYFSMPYGNNGDSTNSYEYWLGGLDFWNSISLAYDSNGNTYGTAAGGDLNANKHGVDTFSIFTSRWGKGDLSAGTGGYTKTQGRFGVEFIGEREYFVDESGNKVGFTNFSKERVKSPSLAAVSTSDTTKSYVYLAYYDSINDEVRFKWGVITNSKDTSDDVGMFANDYDPATRISQGYSISHSSLIAGHTENKLTTTAKLGNNANEDKNAVPVSKIVKTTDGQDVYGGEYVCIAAIPGEGENITLSNTTVKDDVIVAVWWDGTNHQMLYSYNTKPKEIAKGEYLQSDTEWSKPVALFPSEVGEYCKVAVAKDKSVHIAAYDSMNGDLWYAYLPTYNGAAKTGIVDSAGFVGSELNIDVALNTQKKPVPYISYYALSASRPKIATWTGGDLSSAVTVEGAKTDMYTNNWEISVIPTQSKASIDSINVGVWKDTTAGNEGVIKDSVPFPASGVLKYKADGNGHDKNSYGNAYGNGTSNPVLGYATKSGSLGYIETAQMK